MTGRCHKKVKKITLYRKTVLTEEEFTEEIQITLENNPHHYERRMGRELNPEKQ